MNGEPLDDVVLWGIESGSFLEPEVLSGEGLGRLENGVIISELLAERGLKIGDHFILDRVQTELEVVGITAEYNIGHVPIVYTPLRKWQEAAYGPPGGPPPGEKLPDVLYDYASIVALKLAPEIDPQALEAADIEQGTLTVDKQSAYEASSGYREEILTVRLIQGFLIVISAVVIGAFFTVWTIQRTREIGLVKALGASNSYLLRDALGQVLILMVSATLIGILVSIWVGQRFAEAGSSFQLDLRTMFASGGLLIVAGLIGSALSVRLITRVDPIIALGREK
jgi:putative ABC transport system permease protein